MKIAAVLNVHNNEELVLDTIDSIKTYMTKDILVVVDGAFWNWGQKIDFGTPKLQGFYHNCNKGTFRNFTLGLMTLAEHWDADWYCSIEYDVLVASDTFKVDLEQAANRGVWCIGNDLRTQNLQLPLLEKVIGKSLVCSKYLLGCCNFFHRDFLKKLKEIDFFNRFLNYTNSFSSGWFPNYDIQGGYSFAEHLYPTLAYHLGGNIEQFAVWDDKVKMWRGNHHRYPMRFRPDIENAHLLDEAALIHPLKTMNESRIILKGKRNGRIL